IAEAATDRANVEVAAIGWGVVRRIVGGEGGRVPVGNLIGVIAEPSADISNLAASAPSPAAAAAPAPAKAAPALPAMESYKSEPATTSVVPMSPVPAATAGASAGGGRVKASPLARKVAAQSGV